MICIAVAFIEAFNSVPLGSQVTIVIHHYLLCVKERGILKQGKSSSVLYIVLSFNLLFLFEISRDVPDYFTTLQ